MSGKMYKNRTPAEMMAGAAPGKKLLEKLKPKSKSEARRMAVQKAEQKESFTEKFDKNR